MLSVDVTKALSNEKRLQILGWLKSPRSHFPRQAEVRPAHHGHGGEANMAPDDGMGRLDLRVLDGVRHRDGMLTYT